MSLGGSVGAARIGVGDPRYFRVVPGDVARISDPPRLRIQEPVAIPPVIIPKIQEITHTGPGIRLPLSRHTVLSGLEEGQQWQPRAAPVENLMGGKPLVVH